MSPRYDNRSLVGRRGAENERYPLIPSRNSQAKLRNYAGKFVTQRSPYENQFAQWCRASYANLTGSGTVINHIALISMHDETDESNKSFENQTVLTDWEIAKYAQRNDVSNAFYKNSSSVPMSFFWVPGNISTPGGIGQNVQYGNAYNTESGGYNLYNSAYIPYFGYVEYNLHFAQYALASNPQDVMYIAGNYGDASMRGNGLSGDSGTNGNIHYYLPPRPRACPLLSQTTSSPAEASRVL